MNKEQFIQFYDQYIEKIYRFIYFRVDSEEVAQDLASEVFLKLWNFTLASNKELNNPRAFLYQITRNLIADFYRQKMKLDVVLTSSHPEFLEISANDNLVERLAIKSDLDQIKESMKRIKPEQQEALLLHYVEDMETKEVAQILGKSEGAVRVLIHRGLEALKGVLEV